MIEPRRDARVGKALHERVAGDCRRRSVLAGVADAQAVEDVRVERVGRRDRNAVGFGGPHDIVIGADLRRRHDDAVDGRILDDLVQDFELAGRIVGRRLRAEQQDRGADHVAGDSRADIDRVEEAVAGGVGDDGEGQMAVGRVEVLGAGGLLRPRLPSYSRRRPGRCLGPKRRRTMRQPQGRRRAPSRFWSSCVVPPLMPVSGS